MSFRIVKRSCAALLATALLVPAHAFAGGGWGWNSPRYSGYHGGYHNYYGHHGHRGHRGSSGDGWWVAGAIALVGAGLVLANNAERNRDRSPAYVNPSYYGNAVTYDSPPALGSVPVTVPPVSGAVPAASGAAAMPRVGSIEPSTAQGYAVQPATGVPGRVAGTAVATAPRSRADCQRAAVNHSGYDPAAASQWTTAVSVQSYERALQACLAG